MTIFRRQSETNQVTGGKWRKTCVELNLQLDLAEWHYHPLKACYVASFNYIYFSFHSSIIEFVIINFLSDKYTPQIHLRADFFFFFWSNFRMHSSLTHIISWVSSRETGKTNKNFIIVGFFVINRQSLLPGMSIRRCLAQLFLLSNPESIRSCNPKDRDFYHLQK